jgi:exonuclease III
MSPAWSFPGMCWFFLRVGLVPALAPFQILLQMNNRNWNILYWNIRGLNAVDKHDAVRNKIKESGCSIICLQETKMQFVDMQSIRKFAPRQFDKFDFVPSIGASGGLIVIWNSAYFMGVTIEKLPFGITICFTSTFNLSDWKMTTVYGPCHEPERSEFVN